MELASLQAYLDTLLAPPKTEPESAPTKSVDDTMLDALSEMLCHHLLLPVMLGSGPILVILLITLRLGELARGSARSSSTTEDPESFVEELKNVFEVMHIADAEKLELAAYRLKNVPRTWFDQDGCGYEKQDESFCCWAVPSVKQRGQGNHVDWGRGCTKVDGKCRDGSKGCYKCGQEDHFMKECPKNRQSNGNQGNRAQSVAPPDRVAPRRATSDTGEGANRLYAITSRQV
ncbi:uncharacterized protein LOC125868633 [Solanum stenotomum]|uniref:uncharacterized protein LOC125868633 n=1 Tax=Solanum stenotomum TaxID=172797 RepID=UPI0020D172C8|nr:uncharacterized protein LOC125868633 [Solanum stenotomum]